MRGILDFLALRHRLHCRHQMSATYRLRFLCEIAHQESGKNPGCFLLLASLEDDEVFSAVYGQGTGFSCGQQSVLHLGDLAFIVIGIEPGSLIGKQILSVIQTVGRIGLFAVHAGADDAFVVPLHDGFHRLNAGFTIQIAACLRVILIGIHAAQRGEKRSHGPGIWAFAGDQILPLL